MLSNEELEGQRRLEIQMRALGGGRGGGLVPRSVAPVGAATPGGAAVTPKGVVQTINVGVNVIFKESLKQVPNDVLRKMYDEFMAEVSRRGVKL